MIGLLDRLMARVMPPKAAAAPAPVVKPIAPPLSAVDRDILIRTLFGEARGEPVAGQVAVVHVIRNRVLARKSSAAAECRRPAQFSCWLSSDPNAVKLHALRPTDPDYISLGKVADAAWLSPDTVGGARHYFNPAQTPGGRAYWAVPPGREIARIGSHSFWIGVA